MSTARHANPYRNLARFLGFADARGDKGVARCEVYSFWATGFEADKALKPLIASGRIEVRSVVRPKNQGRNTMTVYVSIRKDEVS